MANCLIVHQKLFIDCHSNLFMDPVTQFFHASTPATAMAGGIIFSHFCEHNISGMLLREFFQFWQKCQLEPKEKLIRLLWTEIKGQGHCELLNNAICTDACNRKAVILVYPRKSQTLNVYKSVLSEYKTKWYCLGLLLFNLKHELTGLLLCTKILVLKY